MARSPSTHSCGIISLASFSDGTDSPVSDASCIFKFADSINRKSAGTIAPSSIRTISPTTSSLAGTILSSLWRKTLALGALICFNASRELSAFFSCTIPITALIITIVSMTIASVHSESTAEKTAAPIKISTMGSVIWLLIICQMVFFGF